MHLRLRGHHPARHEPRVPLARDAAAGALLRRSARCHAGAGRDRRRHLERAVSVRRAPRSPGRRLERRRRDRAVGGHAAARRPSRHGRGGRCLRGLDDQPVGGVPRLVGAGAARDAGCEGRRVQRRSGGSLPAAGRPGKIQVSPTKPFKNQHDLSLAYTPGVAEPCREIAQRPEEAYTYTAKGNLVAVVTNGTAVLGLGNIGPLAGKPVMEGKGILFKAFADLDVFDLEVGSENPDDVIRFCQLLEPTVGGINLEDIRSPDCFYIEEKLRETLSIPVFHDDQHGTAIISGAALLNALELVDKDAGAVKVVFAGAGAAAIATAEHYVRLGVQRERIVMCDHKGVISSDRTDLDRYKSRFARKTQARTLAEALRDADVFVGLSVAGIVSGDMLKAMAPRPIVFALANPTPEIMPEEARQARSDAVIATGRSDYPNQVNNVLGFPFIFRGALDVRARKINEAMEMAATRALAALAKEEVPDAVMRAYGLDRLRFGPESLIPKPFDPRVLLWVAPAAPWAAVGSGVAARGLDVAASRAQLA